MKLKLLLFFCILLGQGVSAQDTKKRFIHSMGCSLVADYMAAPATVFMKDGYEEFIDQFEGLNLMTVMYNCRFNLVEFSDELALSANVIPAMGLFIPFNDDVKGLGSVNFPVLLGFETGAGSTYGSSASLGAFVRFGYEWTKAPLIPETEDYPEIKLESSWTQPVAQAGMRFWNKHNMLNEINVKYGFGAKAPEGFYSLNSGEPSRAMSVRISWLFFINY